MVASRGMRPAGRAMRTAAAWALALAPASGQPQVERLPYWVDAGPAGELMQYFIDAESVRKQGPVVHYRLHGRGVQEASRHTSSEAEVGVRCPEKLRVQYVTTVRWLNGVRTSTAAAMAPVVPGSREEAELELACRLAEGAAAGQAPAASGALETEQAGRVDRARGAPRWSGTGFALTRSELVTNRHVVHGCRAVRVLHEDSSLPAAVVARDAARDLALLKVPGNPFRPLALSHRPRDLGEPITVLGFPLADVLGSSLRVTTGIVSALAGVRNDRRMLQITAPVQPGNSGSPVLDEQGHVAGVVVTRMDVRLNTENVSFAVRLPVLREFLQAHAVAYETAPAPRRLVSLPVADVVRKARPGVALVLCD